MGHSCSDNGVGSRFRGRERVCDALAVFALRKLMSIVVLVLPLASPAMAQANSNTDPGTVESVGSLPIEQWTPWAASSQMITYWSTGANGEPMLSNAALFMPEGDPPPGGWPVIARAHGTSGIGDECAPTNVGWGLQTREYVGRFLHEGFAVVATDYAGLGTPGIHPYLDGRSAAHSLIDSVRAARAIEPSLSNVWAATGYSQGGHATMFTSSIANSTAPDLDYRGGVAMAVPSRLERMFPLAGPYVPAIPLSGTTIFFAYILTALRSAHPELNVNSYLSPHGVQVLDGLEEVCLGDAEQKLNIKGIGELLSRPLDDPSLIAAVSRMVEIPMSGYDRQILLVQGLKDEVVPPPVTADLAAELIANHVDLTVRVYPEGHLDTVFASQPDAIAFMHRIFDKR